MLMLFMLLCVGPSPQVLLYYYCLLLQPFVQEAKRLVEERLTLEAKLRQLQGIRLPCSTSLAYPGPVL